MRTLIKNGVITDEKGKERLCDILIEDGKILQIAKEINTDSPGMDAEKNYVIPGLIDMNCDICDPGYENKEDILSVSKAAAKGGFTSITCQPKTFPVIDNKTVVSYILSRRKRQSSVNIFVYGSMTKGLENNEIAEIGEMVNAKIVGLSDGGKCISNAFLMRNILLYSKMFDIPVITMCEDENIARDGVINSGQASTLYGLKGIPKEAEEIIAARNIVLAEHTDAKLHISSVSTEGTVELIRSAKKRGVKVTCETQPHYFTLTEKSIKGYNTFVKVKPPLRTEKDVEAIIKGIKDGTIDVISTGHSPNTIDTKYLEFDLASYGISSLETAFSLSYTALVRAGHISLYDLIEKFSINPASILKLKDKGQIKEGCDADLVIFDKNTPYNIKAGKFASKSKYSPYDNQEVYGKILFSFVKGEIIYSEEQREA